MAAPWLLHLCRRHAGDAPLLLCLQAGSTLLLSRSSVKWRGTVKTLCVSSCLDHSPIAASMCHVHTSTSAELVCTTAVGSAGGVMRQGGFNAALPWHTQSTAVGRGQCFALCFQGSHSCNDLPAFRRDMLCVWAQLS